MRTDTFTHLTKDPFIWLTVWNEVRCMEQRPRTTTFGKIKKTEIVELPHTHLSAFCYSTYWLCEWFAWTYFVCMCVTHSLWCNTHFVTMLNRRDRIFVCYFVLMIYACIVRKHMAWFFFLLLLLFHFAQLVNVFYAHTVNSVYKRIE